LVNLAGGTFPFGPLKFKVGFVGRLFQAHCFKKERLYCTANKKKTRRGIGIQLCKKVIAVKLFSHHPYQISST